MSGHFSRGDKRLLFVRESLCIHPAFIGASYLSLIHILHVSEDMRGKGIGRTLFRSAMDWARERGAAKLYISGHSAVESQAFYRAMGCVEAREYNQSHVEKEPCDCQLECPLQTMADGGR